MSELPIHNSGSCPHCGASFEERGRHAHQGYCEACNGEPSHLAHIAFLRHFADDAITDWENMGDFEMARVLRKRLGASA